MKNFRLKKIDSAQLVVFIHLSLLAFCISLLSNQSFFSNIGPWTDSRVFTTIGKGMANGMVPYRDFFDHKGPLLFFLNFLGYSVSGIHGVWIIEVIAIFVSVLFSYLTIKSLFGRFVALLSVSTGFLLLRRWLEGGNLTEEFAMPLICIALYLFISMLRADSFERWKILLCGLTFGLSLMLRPNMFSVWFVFSVYIVINSLIKKNFSKMMKYIAYFGFCYGNLEYRSLRFEHELLDIPNFQGNAVVNYTDRETPWTRIVEHKWFQFGKDENGNDLPKTVISREYSSEWQLGDEPYYPVNDEKNTALYEKYKQLADKESKVIFGGRLGMYKYYDMDQVIAAALEMSNKCLSEDC